MAASKKLSEKELDTINVGIFGHIDHGKTTLLQRLSGKWADTHSEELKRGITIKLGYADVTIYDDNGKVNIQGKGKPIRHVSFIDCPGHEMLMATTLSGAAIIDLAILVVAANEGILSQTREHLMALKAKRVEQYIVVQNKIDLVSKERALDNYKEIVKLLDENGIKADIVPVCAQQGVNVDKVLELIAQAKVPERDTSEPAIFLVARSFDVNKPGTTPENLRGAVLGGSLKKGTLSVGDEIEIKPGRVEMVEGQKKYISLKTKIRGLFKGSTKVEKLSPGGSVAIETSLD
ncbi:translation initiation factor IF-2 subunit gamma, partial [Candidatus Pacearchaeota archaeon]